MTLPYFQVDTRNERLKTLAVKHTSLWDEFNQKLDISWIYHDHGLEGVVLQYQEISIALNNKVVSDNSFMPMYQEIKNMSAGIEAIRDMLDGKKARERVSRTLLQQCYNVLAQKLRGLPEGDGVRQEDGRYGAYYHKSCAFSEIEAMLKKVLGDASQTSNEDLHPIVQATRLHFQLMKVMPYGRFSGKIGRLIANLMLMRAGYPPAIIHTVERARYYEALAQEDESLLLKLVIEGLNNTVESGLQYIEEGLAERRRKREARKAVKAKREQEKAAKAAKSTKAKATKAKPKATKAAKTTKAAKSAKAVKTVKAVKAVKTTKATTKATAAASTTNATSAKPTAVKTPKAKVAKAKVAKAKVTKAAASKAAAKEQKTPATKAVAAKAVTAKAVAATPKAAKPKAAKATKVAKPKAAKATKAKAKPSAAKKTATGTRQSAKKGTSTKAKTPKAKATSRKPSRAK